MAVCAGARQLLCLPISTSTKNPTSGKISPQTGPIPRCLPMTTWPASRIAAARRSRAWMRGGVSGALMRRAAGGPAAHAGGSEHPTEAPGHGHRDRGIAGPARAASNSARDLALRSRPPLVRLAGFALAWSGCARLAAAQRGGSSRPVAGKRLTRAALGVASSRRRGAAS